MAWEKDRRNIVVICEKMVDDSSEIYGRFKNGIEKRNLIIKTSTEFMDQVGTLIDTVRFGYLQTEIQCGITIKKLLEKNVPVIIVGEDTSENLKHLLQLVKEAMPDMDEVEFKKLIFKVSDEERIEGAIHWAEDFYPFLHDNIERKYESEIVNIERLRTDQALKILLDSKKGE